jgi:polysaccharide export outer membrane protein
MKQYILALVATIILLASCAPNKEMIYFPGMAETADVVQTIPDSLKNFQSIIEPDDMLAITVSALDPNAVAIFNLPTQNFLTPGTTQLITTPSMQTYIVDNEGYIDFPILGKIKVGGMTREELTIMLKKEISNYVDNPIISVQCTNYKFTILGEVTHPGSYKFGSERLTILDALGMANDMTIYGNHTNILLIREKDGERSFHRLDLTQPDIFTSPYYYIQRNDIVYVEPNEARQGVARYSQDKQYTVSIVSAITSAASVIVSLCIALFVK